MYIILYTFIFILICLVQAKTAISEKIMLENARILELHKKLGEINMKKVIQYS